MEVGFRSSAEIPFQNSASPSGFLQEEGSLPFPVPVLSSLGEGSQFSCPSHQEEAGEDLAPGPGSLQGEKTEKSGAEMPKKQKTSLFSTFLGWNLLKKGKKSSWILVLLEVSFTWRLGRHLRSAEGLACPGERGILCPPQQGNISLIPTRAIHILFLCSSGTG